MVNEYEIAGLVETRIPEITEALRKANVGSNISNADITIQCLSDFTFKNVKERNMSIVKKCFAVAEKLYMSGNSIVRNAIDSIYIYSFSKLLNACENEFERNNIQSIMPVYLYSAYVKQVLKSR